MGNVNIFIFLIIFFLDELAFMRSTESLLEQSRTRELARERIEVFRLKDANATAPSDVCI